MGATNDYKTMSFWMRRGHYAPGPRLEQDRSSDVVVVGGGFTGLWSAIHLKEADPSLDVVMLEQNVIGYGASGRNAGFALTTLERNLSQLLRRVGSEKTRAQRVSTSGVRIIGSLSRRPIWLLGIAVQMTGFGLHFLALTRAPVTVVQPIIAAGITFVVIFTALLLRERPGRREIGGMVLAISGVILLVTRLEGPATMARVSVGGLFVALAVTAALIAGLLGLAASRQVQKASIRAVMLGSAAGLGYGMSDAMNRLMGTWLSPGQG